jgi:hypothetical protein
MRLFLDQLGPKFNAVEGVDFGPGPVPGQTQSGNQIRYSILDFKKLLKLFLTEYIKEGTWAGPIAGSASLWTDNTHTGGNRFQTSFTTNAPYDHFRLNANVVHLQPTGVETDEGEFFVPGSEEDFPPDGACPFISPEPPGGPQREGAHLVEFANSNLLLEFTLMNPAIEQASWREATHVWLPFAWTVFAVHSFEFLCNPSGIGGGLPGFPFNTNILGVDYAAGGGGFGIPPTSSIALGDGTTHLFLWSPTDDRFTLDALNTRVGLD